ncbi:MAG: DUF1328 domain-containing protein [Pseudomonadota bacterium]
MLPYAIAFLVVALIAALFALGGPIGAVAVAEPAFILFVLMAAVSFAIGMTRRH